MKTFNVPYTKGFVDINIPDQNIVGVLESKAHSYKAELSQEALVEHALDNPIGSQRLEELVRVNPTWSSSQVTIRVQCLVKLRCQFYFAVFVKPIHPSILLFY